MALVVRAKVVDITSDAPKLTDVFLVDTNAWYWLFYARASLLPEGPRPYQLATYPAYVQAAVASAAKLHCCALTFSELAHNVEKAEREICADAAGKSILPKSFRHDYPNKHRDVVKLAAETWGDVLTLSTLLHLNLDDMFMQSALTLFPSVCLDGYDLFMAEAALKAMVTQVITDDGDYATVPGLTVFTANQNVINAARANGKLVVR